MKRFVQILIIALLLLGASGVYAITINGTQIGPRELHLGKPLGLGGVPEGGWVDDPRQPSYYKYSNETLNSVLSAPGTLSTADRGVILAELQLRSDLAAGIVPPHTSAETMRVDQYEEAFNNTLYNRTGNHFQPNGQMVNQAGTPINNSAPVDSAGNAKAEAFPNCGLDPFCGLVKAVAWLLQKVVITLFSWLSVLANQIFDLSIDISVRNFASIANSDGINVAWRVMRNLVNITFIFVLLYVAIGTILRLDSVNGKKLLSKIIIAALLVNFSAFFTRIMIDASNVVANQLYSAAGPSTNGSAPDVIGQLTQAADLGYKKTLANEAEKAVWANSSSVTGTADKYTILLQIIVAAIGTIILMVISTAVLVAGAIMFFTRSIVLVFLIATAPVAFLAFAVGGSTLGKIASEWKNNLANQLVFAPAYMLLIYLTVQVVTKGNQITNLNTSFAGGIATFAVINGLMLGSLIVAKKLGVAGAGAATGSLKSLKKLGAGALGGATFGAAGFAARNTLGRMSRAVADSEKLKEAGTRSGITGFLARTTLRAGSGVASSSFDARATSVGKGLDLGKAGGKGGYDKNVKDKIENQKKVAELLVPGDPAKEKVADIDKQEKVVADTKAEITKLETAVTDPLNPQLAGAQKTNIEALKAKLEKENIKLATLKKQKDDIEATGKERQRTYAENREAGGAWSTIFTGSTKSNRRKQARAIRAEAKKTKKEKDAEKWSKRLEKALKEDEKEDKEEEPKQEGKKE